MSSVPASLAAAGMAAALGVTAAVDGPLLAGGLALVQAVFALTAVRSSGSITVRATAWLTLAAGWVALAWMVIDDSADLVPVVAVLGPTLLAAFVIQLTRHGSRPRLTFSLALSVAACVMSVSLVFWLALHAVDDVGMHAVELGLLGIGIAALTETLPISRAVRRVIGVLLSAGIATGLVLVVSGLRETVPPVGAVVVAAFAGLMTTVAFAIVDRIDNDLRAPVGAQHVTVPNVENSTGEAAPSEPAASPIASYATAGLGPLRATLPFIAAAPAVYVLGRIVIELPS